MEDSTKPSCKELPSKCDKTNECQEIVDEKNEINVALTSASSSNVNDAKSLNPITISVSSSLNKFDFEDSDSEFDAGSLNNYFDLMSNFAELTLEECKNLDNCSISSHTVIEPQKISGKSSTGENDQIDVKSLQDLDNCLNENSSQQSSLTDVSASNSTTISFEDKANKECKSQSATEENSTSFEVSTEELGENCNEKKLPFLGVGTENYAENDTTTVPISEFDITDLLPVITNHDSQISPVQTPIVDVGCNREDFALGSDFHSYSQPVVPPRPVISEPDESNLEPIEGNISGIVLPNSEEFGRTPRCHVTFDVTLLNDDECQNEVETKNIPSNYEDVGCSVVEPIYETINYDLVPPKKKKHKRAKNKHSRSNRSSRSSRSSTVSGPWDERLYEDIADISSPSTGSQGLTNDLESIHLFSNRLQVHRQLSSSDSWGSEEFESYSSNDEDDKNTSINDSNTSESKVTENLKQRILRKREQWREKRQSSRNLKFSLRKDSKEKDATESLIPTKDSNEPQESSQNTESRLYRWFSLRKNNYDVERKTSNLSSNSCDRNSAPSYIHNNGTPTFHGPLHNNKHRMPRLQEEVDQHEGATLFSQNAAVFDVTFQRRYLPPSLPPPPCSISQERLKRRYIIAAIVHSENNYVATLHRLVNEFQVPLQESKPLIISRNKCKTLFYRLSDVLKCHTMFRMALTDCVRHWDRDEKIGDVFVASFSKGFVLDFYSDFINNFSRAMEVYKQEEKKKSAFSDFLKMRQITSNDRLSFFGLMVKPIQRFPQFILCLQDLLKHTPHDHHDRMSLQLALTQLESLAENLNERKRESEQYQAFKDTLKHINRSTKFISKSLGYSTRYLLRQDNVMQLEFNPNGTINKTKDRRLFLTNDLMICVSVVPKSGDDFSNSSERLSLKWSYPVVDVEITDTSSSPTLSRLLAAGLSKTGSTRILEDSSDSNNVESLVQDMNNLMQDYEILSRIAALVSTFKGTYDELTPAVVQRVGSSIQRAIHQKDEQMVWVDACCLQFSIKTKEGKEKETITFQTDNPKIKKDWIVELRLAQLALDKNNSPAWDLPDNESTPSTKLPLFVKSLPVYSSKHQTEVKCGCCYTVTSTRVSRSGGRQMMFLWLCSSDGVSSHLTIFQMQQVGLRELIKVDLTEMCVSTLQHVPALGTCYVGGNEESSVLKSHTVWMGTDSHRLFVYSGLDPEKQVLLSSSSLSAAITTIKYHCDQVFVGLSNGSIEVYRRGTEGDWLLNDPLVITLDTEPITALLPISTQVYASCANTIYVIDCFTTQVLKEFGVQNEGNKNVALMAHSGIGLWIAQKESSSISLFHTETFHYLQSIDVASNVTRMLSETGHTQVATKVFVTSLIASKGLLWVGTNAGVALTIPLPRLEGVPIISGRANISFHAHIGPITFLLALQSQSGRSGFSSSLPDSRFRASEAETQSIEGRSATVPPNLSRLEKQRSEGCPSSSRRPLPQMNSPVLRRHNRESRRLSKTLPRNVGGLSESQECDLYGVCGALLNVQNYGETLNTECTILPLNSSQCGTLSRYDSLRRSDPELALPAQLSTLDRRVRLKASRPRSLDLSSWSVDSRTSSACTANSSGSEECSHVTQLMAKSPSSSSFAARNNKVKNSKVEQPRTLMVVMGGRGYINWQRAEPLAPNTKDAHIVIWEMKL